MTASDRDPQAPAPGEMRSRPQRGQMSYRYSARDLLTNPQVIVDSVVPLLVFVTANALWGLSAAAAAALGLSVWLMVVRLVRRDRLLFAMSGLGGVTVAVLTALWAGEAAGYLGPGMVLNVAYAVVSIGSIMVRRPLIGWSSWLIYRWPLAWYWHDRVRPAYSEITWAWAGLFAARAYVRYRIIAGGSLGISETAVVLVTGWPAFALLLLATYAYVTWRLKTLDAPDVDAFRRACRHGHGSGGLRVDPGAPPVSRPSYSTVCSAYDEADRGEATGQRLARCRPVG